MSFDAVREIETERLALRPARMADADAMFRNWASDPEVTKFLTWGPYGSVAEAEGFLARELSKDPQSNLRYWLISLKSTGETVGSIGFVREEPEIGALYVEFSIGRRWWGSEIMPEALRAVIEGSFKWLGAKRIVLQHDAANKNASRVAEKSCMAYEGLMRQAAVNNRGVVDICQYAIMAYDYEEACAPRTCGESAWQVQRTASVMRVVYERLCRSSVYELGAEFAVLGDSIFIPPRALRDAFSNIGFSITLHWSSLEPLARSWLQIRTTPMILDRRAVEEAVARFGDACLEWGDDSFCSGYFQVWVPFGGVVYEGLPGDIASSCLLLDAAVVETRAVQLEAGLIEGFERFDVEECLVDLCFDSEFAAKQAKAFHEGHPGPDQQLRAAYALPYNLDWLLDNSMTEYVEEADPLSFAFEQLVHRRLPYLGNIIAALEGKWFDLKQIAYIVCSDAGLPEWAATLQGCDEFCQKLKDSDFDPMDVDQWGSYASCGGSCLVDYL